MTKMYIGPHHAADLKVKGLWDPATMTTDKSEANSRKSPTKTPAKIDPAPMKPPLPTDIVVGSFEPRVEPSSAQPLQPGARVKESDQEQELLDAARAYAGVGYKVIPLKHRSKEPEGSWTGPSLTETEIAAKFASGEANIGVAFGADSNGLVDFDFDSPIAARIANTLFAELPAYGRSGAPRSHRWVICKEAADKINECRHVSFKLPASLADHPRLRGPHGAMILEVRANGCYSMAPPSTHPTGEKVAADGNLLAPPQWFWAQIVRAGGLVAFLDLCVRFYPPIGTRHLFCMALTGTLLRALMNNGDFKQFDDETALINFVDGLVRLVGDLAGGGKSHKLKFAANTLAKVKANSPATELKTTLTLLGVPTSDHGRFAFWIGGDPDERPLIEHNEIDIRRVLREAETALLEADAPVFQRGGQHVHVYRLEKEEREDGENGKIKWFRPAGALGIRPVSAARLRLYLDEYIRFFKERKGKDDKPERARVPAPFTVARDYAAMIDECRLRVLRGVVETPTLRADNSVLETPGYDRQSGLLFDPGGVTFPSVPEHPTKTDAEAALKIIDEIIKGFPFDGNPNGLAKCPSRSVALSMIITALACRTLSAVPLHLGDAPVAGNGKTLLVDCAAIVATGKELAKMAQGRDEAEDEKRLVGALLRGDGLLLVDNIEQPIGGDFLCSVITESVVQVRPLGQTGQVDVPTNLLICATGNNIKVRGDMTRRCVKCRIDAGKERPEERDFRGDLRAYVRKHRAELVVAGLTILRAFAVAPDRQDVIDDLAPYGSFTEWSDRVRGALVWLGEHDPCETRELIRDDDPVTAGLAGLVAAWTASLGTGEVKPNSNPDWHTTTQIVAAANEADPHDYSGLMRPLLHGSLTAVMPRGVTPDGLGRYLSRFVDRVVGKHRLRKRKNPETRQAEYLIEVVGPGSQAEVPAQAELGLTPDVVGP